MTFFAVLVRCISTIHFQAIRSTTICRFFLLIEGNIIRLLRLAKTKFCSSWLATNQILEEICKVLVVLEFRKHFYIIVPRQIRARCERNAQTNTACPEQDMRCAVLLVAGFRIWRERNDGKRREEKQWNNCSSTCAHSSRANVLYYPLISFQNS